MPIEVKISDGGRGSIIESSGIVADQEFVDFLRKHFIEDEEQFKTCKYILFDYTALRKLMIADKTVELISKLFARASKTNPDPVVAIVTYFSMAVDREQINKITRLCELFLNGTSWESLLFRTKMEAVRWIRKKVNDKFGVDDLTFS